MTADATIACDIRWGGVKCQQLQQEAQQYASHACLEVLHQPKIVSRKHTTATCENLKPLPQARELFGDLQRSAQPVPPLNFWMQLREAHPQFNQTNRMVRAAYGTLLRSTTNFLKRPDVQQMRLGAIAVLPCPPFVGTNELPLSLRYFLSSQGQFSQQDAEECWSQLMYTLRSTVQVGHQYHCAEHRLARRLSTGIPSRENPQQGEPIGTLPQGLSSGELKLHVPGDLTQDPQLPDRSVIDRLFGVKLHTSLKCEESGETIEVGAALINSHTSWRRVHGHAKQSAVCCKRASARVVPRVALL